MRGQAVQETDNAVPRPPMHWKKSCAAILAQTVSSSIIHTYSSPVIAS